MKQHQSTERLMNIKFINISEHSSEIEEELSYSSLASSIESSSSIAFTIQDPEEYYQYDNNHYGSQPSLLDASSNRSIRIRPQQ